MLNINQNSEQSQDFAFIKALPKKLRLELYEIMHRATIKEMYFFKNKPLDFIKYAAQYLKMEKLLNQGYLYKENDVLDRGNTS